MNKVLEKVSVNEENIQENIDNLKIGERIDNLNTLNSRGGTLTGTLVNSFKDNLNLLKSSAISGYKLSRATFLEFHMKINLLKYKNQQMLQRM